MTPFDFFSTLMNKEIMEGNLATSIDDRFKSRSSKKEHNYKDYAFLPVSTYNLKMKQVVLPDNEQVQSVAITAKINNKTYKVLELLSSPDNAKSVMDTFLPFIKESNAKQVPLHLFINQLLFKTSGYIDFSKIHSVYIEKYMNNFLNLFEKLPNKDIDFIESYQIILKQFYNNVLRKSPLPPENELAIFQKTLYENITTINELKKNAVTQSDIKKETTIKPKGIKK